MANQSTFAAPQKADNWRAVVGSKLPDGTTDVTEGIYHDGTVHLGNANSNNNTRFEHLGIASYTGNGNFISQVIQTNIPKDSLAMPAIYLKGYDYTSGGTVDVQVSLYAYNVPSGSIINTVWQSKGTSSPATIKAGWNASNLLALEVTWATARYFNRYQVDAYSDGPSGGQTDAMFENWVITNALFDASITQVVTLANKDKAVTLPFATPAETIAGTSTNTIVNPADLYARENIPAVVFIDHLTAPAPAAGQSTIGRNANFEIFRYDVGVNISGGSGWVLISRGMSQTFNGPVNAVPNIASGTVATVISGTAPRTGIVSLSARTSFWVANPAVGSITQVAAHIRKNGVVVAAAADSVANNPNFAVGTAQTGYLGFNPNALGISVAAGDTLSLTVVSINTDISPNTGDVSALTYQYTN